MTSPIDRIIPLAKQAGDTLRQAPAQIVAFGRNNPSLLPMAAPVAAALLFFLLAVTLFTYVRFPVEKLGPMIEQATARAGQPVQVTIGGIEKSFPFGLSLSGVNLYSVNRGGGRTPVADIAELTLSPSLLSLATGGRSFSGSAELLEGEVAFSGALAGELLSSAQVEIDGVKIGQAALWEGFPWGRIEGALNGEGSVILPKGDPGKADGEASLRVDGGVLSLSQALLPGLSPIPLTEAVAKATAEEGVVTLEALTLKGEGLTITGGGKITLRKDIRFSRLDLKFTIQLEGGVKEKLGPFMSMLKSDGQGGYVANVGGTFARPMTR